MKRFAIMMSLLAVCVFASNSSAAVDTTAISTNVETIVAMIDAGKDANGIQSKDYEPYAFVMEDGGKCWFTLLLPVSTTQKKKNFFLSTML